MVRKFGEIRKNFHDSKKLKHWKLKLKKTGIWLHLRETEQNWRKTGCHKVDLQIANESYGSFNDMSFLQCENPLIII